jgi:hypothetical protein
MQKPHQIWGNFVIVGQSLLYTCPVGIPVYTSFTLVKDIVLLLNATPLICGAQTTCLPNRMVAMTLK